MNPTHVTPTQVHPTMPDERPVALVTGGSRGIGRAICAELGRTHHVLVGGTRADSVAEVVASLPSAEPFVADLTDEQAVASAAAKVGRLDALVHSAGIGGFGDTSGSTRERWRRVLELNVVAVVDLTELLIEKLRENHGIVVAINSGAGHNASPGNGLYPASKFALRAYTDALRGREMGRVRVTSIHPGRVDTDMQHELIASEGKQYDATKYLSPDAVAETVRLAIDTDPRGQINELSIRPFN